MFVSKIIYSVAILQYTCAAISSFKALNFKHVFKTSIDLLPTYQRITNNLKLLIELFVFCQFLHYCPYVLKMYLLCYAGLNPEPTLNVNGDL